LKLVGGCIVLRAGVTYCTARTPTTISNVTRAIDALLRKWEAEAVNVGNPNSQRRIEEYERNHQARLPDDFKQYLLKANGMQPCVPHDTDKNGYCFWPLERIRSAADEFRKPQHRVKETELLNPDLAGYFIFGDYLQWSWAFAIQTSGTDTEKSQVFRVDGPQVIQKLAGSFAEFIDLYVADSARLYDPSAFYVSSYWGPLLDKSASRNVA
jgi:SMI1 / KNR4 family (SUKH-1)